jgi:hypothetical protein
MKLTTQQAYALLEKHGSYITEICDHCGKGIGPVRLTRKDDPGVWCSRECRGDGDRHVIRKGGRPRKHMTDAERQRVYRANLRVTKPPCSLAEAKDLQAQKSPLSTTPLTRPLSARKQPLGAPVESERPAATVLQ